MFLQFKVFNVFLGFYSFIVYIVVTFFIKKHFSFEPSSSSSVNNHHSGYTRCQLFSTTIVPNHTPTIITAVPVGGQFNFAPIHYQLPSNISHP